MPYLCSTELAHSNCIGARQRIEQVQRPTIEDNDISHWLLGMGSWVQTNEPSSAQKISINLEDKDVKPLQTTDLLLIHPSGPLPGSFESGEQYRWSGHWSMGEAEWRTGSNADTRRNAEAEVDRVGQDSKLENVKGLGAIKEGTYGAQETGVVCSQVDGYSASSRKERDGEMLLRWAIQNLEDPWHPGRGEGILQ